VRFSHTALPDVICIEPAVHRDERGFFLESYQQARFAEAGIPEAFVQDNHSGSAKGVLRGLHYQVAPMAQGKLVRVVRGRAFDVAVDIRRGSPTFGRWVGEELSADDYRMLYIPAGFAHGFLALEDGTEVLYKVTAPFSLAHDRGILWSDPDIGIRWPDLGMAYRISDKDQRPPRLRDANV
jgi:dTDP-4-dehydrorhamnose 3,5-epimerase